MGSESAVIERHSKTSRQFYKHILAFKEFFESIFLFKKNVFKSKLLLAFTSVNVFVSAAC